MPKFMNILFYKFIPKDPFSVRIAGYISSNFETESSLNIFIQNSA